LLDLCDSLGDLNATWAGFGAVEGGTAAPYAFFVVEHLKTHVATFVTVVEDEAVCVDDGCWAEVLAVGPEDWAGRRASCTQDALGGVIEGCASFGGLQTFA